MSRSNHDKPFYVDVGTSVVAIRCASNHDVIAEYDYGIHPPIMQLAKEVCDRMNKEADIEKPRRNCDVGDAGEQSERFTEFCCWKCDGSNCKHGLDIDSVISKCAIKWAQMPYNEGGAE